ncbi:MAG: nucleotidyltransferase substrate binding protein [Deltaproteobacteria bacterium]|nr:nucleotidyltransferase substrate binding protein [Deltaproteobacteria bacterium]
MPLTHVDSMKQQTIAALQCLHAALEHLQQAASDKALQDILEDAVVKRFEVLFEYVWKLLKAAAEYQGVEAPGPRPAIREGVRFGWITDPDFWAVALDARNGSVHDYFGMLMSEYLKLIVRFAQETSTLLDKLSQSFDRARR